MKTQFLRWLALAITLAAGQQATAAGTQFAADMVLKAEGQTQVMRYYHGNQKMRTETKMEDGSRVISIIDIPGKKMITLMPETNTYMEMTGVDESQGWFDGKDFAEQAKNDPDYAVKKVGSEMVNGYLCDKYVSVPKKADLEQSTTWFAPKLGYPVKSISPSHTMELTNIKEGTQPASLFTVPKGYQKMSGLGAFHPGALPSEDAAATPQSAPRQPSVIEEDAQDIAQDARNEVKNATKDEISDSIRKGIRGLFGKD